MPPRAPPPTAEVPPAGAPTLASLLTLATGVVIVTALYLGRDVFLPIAMALLLSFVLAPFVNLLRRVMSRGVAVVGAVLLTLCVLLALSGVIGVQVAQIARELPRYEATIRGKIDSVRAGTLGRASELLQNIDRRVREAAEEEPEPPQEETTTRPAERPRPIPVEMRQPEPTPTDLAMRVISPLLGPLGTTAIVLIVTIFLLLQREDLRDRVIRLVGTDDLHKTTVAMDDAAARLSRFFLLQFAMNATYGVVIASALWLIGIPGALLWGIVAALMRYVPYVGSIIAAAAPVLLATAVDPGWSTVLVTLALYVVLEPLMGNVIEPMAYGKSTGLSPFAVILAAIFWTWLWGPVGLLISTPLTVCLVVLGRHVERMHFLDVLLGDRPALTPAENFYQRMLAGDPDEAHEQAEVLLRKQSLSSYYDEVALKGLQLAAADASRGVLSRTQLELVRTSMRELIDDLADNDDVEPAPEEEGPVVEPVDERELGTEPVGTVAPPQQSRSGTWAGERPILCVAGRGPLDEAASAMLAQLLDKHGLGARVVPHEAVSRGALENLDVEGVAMVCISYLEIRGTPAHLRFLLRRIRQRLPDAPIQVGLWPTDDPVVTDERMRARLGADYQAMSLRQAVTQCIEAAWAEVELKEETPPVLQAAAGSG